MLTILKRKTPVKRSGRALVWLWPTLAHRGPQVCNLKVEHRGRRRGGGGGGGMLKEEEEGEPRGAWSSVC